MTKQVTTQLPIERPSRPFEDWPRLVPALLDGFTAAGWTLTTNLVDWASGVELGIGNQEGTIDYTWYEKNEPRLGSVIQQVRDEMALGRPAAIRYFLSRDSVRVNAWKDDVFIDWDMHENPWAGRHSIPDISRCMLLLDQVLAKTPVAPSYTTWIVGRQ